jgi:glycosyltransferase involved in cell wall biosynthesis
MANPAAIPEIATSPTDNSVRQRPVRVLINAIHAHSGGGVTYLRHILTPLAADPDLQVHLCLHERQQEILAPMDVAIRTHLVGCSNNFYRRLIWEQTVLPVFARRLGIDVTFSPANFGPLLAPAPVVLLRNALEVAETETRLSKRLYWSALAFMTKASLLRCPRAIAVSDYARRALTRGLPAAVRARVDVVHHGVGGGFSPPEPDRPREDFLLTVSDIYIQKNLHRLLQALDILKADFPAIRLKIAGSPIDAEYSRQLSRIITERKLGDHVDLLGRVRTDELAELYRRCALFVFPSLVETFGNPLVEAMACGAPVVSANTAAMPEVLGDAALFFDPTDVAAMAARIADALGDANQRHQLSERAVIRAGAFSWGETARRTADVIKACVPRNRLRA